MRIFSAVLGLSAVVSGCASVSMPSTDVADRIWSYASVNLPPDPELSNDCRDVERYMSNDLTVACLSQINGPRPVVVFMHGCSGMQQDNYLAMLRRLGYIVVAPNSLIAWERKIACPTNAYTVSLRVQEAKLVADRLKGAKWADTKRLVLAGFSEGAVATARYDGDEYRAKLVFAWTCTSISILFQGLASEPALSFVGTDDPWHQNQNVGECGHYMRDKRSRSVVYQGVGHDVLAARSAETTAAVKTFLELVLR